MPLNRHLVFVYGSLRRGNAGAMSVRFPEARFIADGRVRGSLYDLGAYPGLKLNESASFVIGEIYEVDEHTLSELDQFELSSDYIRKEVNVEHNHQRSHCWIYVPPHDEELFSVREVIESGDWIQHIRSRP